MAKKLSTREILEKARAEAAGKKQDEVPPGQPDEKTETSPEEQTSGGGSAKETPVEKKPVTPAAGGDKPKSTKDILAAARAQAGGETETPQKESTEKPSGEKKAAGKTPAASRPSGERPSVQEMLKAVRESKPPEQVEAKPTPTKPVLPPHPRKPAPAEKPKAEQKQTRRWFLLAILSAPLALISTPFAAAWTLFTAAIGAWVLGLARFMMPNVLVEPPSKFKIGPPSDYPFGAVDTKWKSEFATWIVHTEYDGQAVIYALSTVCTHLGCTPNWLEAEQKFKCPCHGSGFYINGINFEGPAPRPLERFAIRLAPDGMLEVDKSAKFQEEMGQWEDSASFYVPTA